MEKIQTIREACNGVAEAMERLRYSPNTIKEFQWDCRHFLNYAIQNTGTDSPNDKICADYLRDGIGYPFTEDRALDTKEADYISASAGCLNTSSTGLYSV